MGSLSPAIALELLDKHQGRKQQCLCLVYFPGSWCSVGARPSAWAELEPGAAPGMQLAAVDVRNLSTWSNGLGILWETAQLATGREGT